MNRKGKPYILGTIDMQMPLCMSMIRRPCDREKPSAKFQKDMSKSRLERTAVRRPLKTCDMALTPQGRAIMGNFKDCRAGWQL